jgi:hypothetical protein
LPQLLLLLVCLGVAPAGQGKQADCELEVRPELVERLGAARSQRILSDLTTIYRTDPAFKNPLSGKAIDATGLVWLKRFCIDYRIEYLSDFSSALFSGLHHVATIVKVYPNWQDILSSPAFERWVDSLSPERQEEIVRIENFGDAQQVIALLKEYQASKPADSPPESPPESRFAPPAPAAENDGQAVSYRLVEDDFNALRSKGEIVKSLGKDPLNLAPPPAILELLQAVKGVAYPDEDLFSTALRVKLDARIQAYARIVLDYADRRGIVTLNEESFKELEKAVPPAILDSMASLRGQAFADRNELRRALDDESKRLADQCALYRKTVLALARKAHRFDPGKPPLLDGGDCGCVRRHLAGPVYGFYPFWLAGEARRIDFGGLSRLVYDRLGFDERGDLLDDIDPNALDPGFLKLARQHETQVDWAIRHDDWQAWQGYPIDKKASVFDRLAGHLAGLSQTRLADPVSRLAPYLSLGFDSVPTLGDGFALDFAGYPQDRDSIDAFDDFLKNLKDRLKQDGNPHTLSILFSRSALGEGIYGFDNLIRLIDAVTEKGAQQDIDIRFLVWLEEPVEDSKKALRKAVEDGLDDSRQRKLLRKIVPMIEYDGQDQASLEESIVYFQDNFGGIGFWPLVSDPAAPPAGGKDQTAADRKAEPGKTTATPVATLARLLEAHFLAGNAQPESAVCDFVCPNRWLFRGGFLALAGLFLLFGGLYWRACPCRAWLAQRLTLVLGGAGLPFLASGLALLACDPPLAGFSEGRWPMMALIAAIVVYSLWRYAKRRREADKP